VRICQQCGACSCELTCARMSTLADAARPHRLARAYRCAYWCILPNRRPSVRHPNLRRRTAASSLIAGSVWPGCSRHQRDSTCDPKGRNYLEGTSNRILSHTFFGWRRRVFTGYRGFESTSLQRGVYCEPDSLDRVPNISCRHQFTRVPKARNRCGPVAAKRRRRERSHPAPELSMKQPP